MKRILVDTNFNWLGPDCPILSRDEVSRYGLAEGERIQACQDDDEWEAVVCFDASVPYHYQWFVRLLPDKR